jgi:hypothetical protein
MKAITLQQPWASLVAAGATNIVTQAWQTEYRGRLAIHAAGDISTDVRLRVLNQRVKSYNHSYEGGDSAILNALYSAGFKDTSQLPLGAVIATCELVDMAPIGGATDFRTGIVDGDEGDYPGRSVVVVHDDGVVLLDAADQHVIDITDQKPYNDFAPGRFAWILGDVKPVEERCPLCWGEGSWPHFMRQVCPLCKVKRVTAPVPARGHSGLWDWEFR